MWPNRISHNKGDHFTNTIEQRSAEERRLFQVSGISNW